MPSYEITQFIECHANVLHWIKNMDNICAALLEEHPPHICGKCSQKIEELYFKNRIEEDKKMETALEYGEITQIEYDNWEIIRVKEDSMFVRNLYFN
jgi:hypothetical protein